MASGTNPVREMEQAQDVLIAQYYFARNISREELLADLIKWPAWRRTDVATCNEWLYWDFEDLKRNERLFRPFQCNPGPFYMRKKRETEFYILRLFLIEYSQLLESAFYISKYNEEITNPDFIVQELAGEQIGVELTVSTPSQWIKNYKMCAPILRRSFEELEKQGIHLIFDPSLLDGNWGFEENGLLDELRTCQLSAESPNRHLGNLAFEINDSSIYIFKRGDQNGYVGDYYENKNAEFMVQRIKDKLAGPEPSVKPCTLVLFPFWKLGIDHHDVCLKAARGGLAKLNPSSHFDEIWYIYEGNQKAYRIVP